MGTLSTALMRWLLVGGAWPPTRGVAPAHTQMGDPVYKIHLSKIRPRHERAKGRFHGSPVDAPRRLHSSFGGRGKWLARLAAHFAGQDGLVLLAVNSERLSAIGVRWEKSRGGELFPHLYGPLDLRHVVRIRGPLPLGDDGLHRLPDGVAT